MIQTLKITLQSGLWAEGPWTATIAADEASTLEDLHHIIQQAVDFDDDHLYGFYVARTPRSRERIYYEAVDECGNESDALFATTVENLFPLPKNRKLFYLFDYGDSWTFQVSRTNNKPFLAKRGVDYPLLISTTGEKPVQYPDSDDMDD